jgi:hypothetical protein
MLYSPECAWKANSANFALRRSGKFAPTGLLLGLRSKLGFSGMLYPRAWSGSAAL